MSFEDIEFMSKFSFKKLVKQKVAEAAFKYLIEEKNKQSKISNIRYTKLEMQKYLLEGNRNIEISKLVFKARGRTLDIKTNKKWKYDDVICIGCGENIETEEEILTCTGFADKDDKPSEKIAYNLVFSDSVKDMQKVAKLLNTNLRKRQKLLEMADFINT